MTLLFLFEAFSKASSASAKGGAPPCRKPGVDPESMSVEQY